VAIGVDLPKSGYYLGCCCTGVRFAFEPTEERAKSTSFREIESKNGWFRIESQPSRYEDSSSSSSMSRELKR